MKSIEDLLYPVLNVYNKMPLKIRNGIGLLYKLLPKKVKYGRFYNEYLLRIQNFSKDKGNEQEEVVRNILLNQVNYAIEEVPFYKKFPALKNINEIENFPVITKERIKENTSLFINRNLKHKGLKSNTGGSSGEPFSFYIEQGVTRPKEVAHFDWFWGKYGYKAGDKVLMIRGKSLKNNADFEFQSIGNKLVISCYNLNRESIRAIHLKIKEFKPKFIHAYPSSLLIFTKEFQFYLDSDRADFDVDAIFLGSEKLFREDESHFEKFYQSKVVTWYGHSECLVHGAKCQLSGDFHFFPFYGFMELVDENDKPINEPGVEGRIIATGFDNKVMPLIRYDTGDLGELSKNFFCKCGFKGKSLSKISGRGKDYLILKDNAKVPLTAFIFGQHHEEFSEIKEIQLIQSEPGIAILKIVPLVNFKIQSQERLKKRLLRSVKDGLLDIKIEIVNKTEKTHRGKHRLLIQNLDI